MVETPLIIAARFLELGVAADVLSEPAPAGGRGLPYGPAEDPATARSRISHVLPRRA